MRAPAFFLLIASVVSPLGCGSDDSSGQTKTDPGDRSFDAKPKTESKAEDAKQAEAAKPDLGADPFGAEQWDTDAAAPDTDADAAAEAEAGEPGAEAEPRPHPGPCKIRWSTGAIVRFDYDEDGSGKVRVDQDADGKADACGTFETSENEVIRVRIDEGCDHSIDVVLEPEHDANLNLATASYETTEDGKKTRRQVTLVTMTQFTGLDPGYALQAPRKKVKLRSKDKLVRSAEVRDPEEGPPMKVTFTYDAQGRVKRIKEDHELDGTTNRQFDYRYDDRGNVAGMRVLLGAGDEQQRGTARIDYSCHED